jgi:alpha-1,2-mannosyltransferase
LEVRSGVVAGRQAWLRLGFVVVAVALLVNATQLWDWRLGVDFHTYYAATKIALDQGWAHLYDQGVIAQEQKELVPHLWSQPFLSPPMVAWLTAPLSPLPYKVAYFVWAASMFLALALALAWAGSGSGLGRWIAVVGVLSTWFVMHAVDVGQVVPLIAASMVLAWRLIREKHDIAAGLVLAAVLLKPNTAILVPFALLLAGRLRVFEAWLGASAVILMLAYLIVGANGMSNYVEQLLAPLPNGSDLITIKGAFGAVGIVALVLRMLITGATLATSYRLHGSPGLVIAVGIMGSLLIAPYLHDNDLSLLAVAAWMILEDRPTLAWRIPLAAAWLLASPFLYVFHYDVPMYRWPLIELALFAAFVISAWRPFTRWADVRTQAPA